MSKHQPASAMKFVVSALVPQDSGHICKRCDCGLLVLAIAGLLSGQSSIISVVINFKYLFNPLWYNAQNVTVMKP